MGAIAMARIHGLKNELRKLPTKLVIVDGLTCSVVRPG